MVLLIIFGFAAFAFKVYYLAPKTAPIDQTEVWQTYENQKYKIKISYPKPFIAINPRYEVGNFYQNNKGAEKLLSLVLQKENYPDTNYYESFLELSVLPGIDEPTCLIAKHEGAESELTAKPVQINGQTFWKAQTRDAAAGTFATIDVYHSYANSICYEVTLSLFEGNIANFDPPIKQVNEQEVYSRLESILDTLEIK